MNQQQLLHILNELDKNKIYVFSVAELNRWLPNEKTITLKKSLSRHCLSGLLHRPCRGIYMNLNAKCRDSYPLDHIAKSLRSGEYTYVSLESLLSEAGVISQIPIDTLTLMTTGRKQIYRTTFGTIEFVHTHRSIANILTNTIKVPSRPLRIATATTAYRDLQKARRNTHLVDLQELKDAKN